MVQARIIGQELERLVGRGQGLRQLALLVKHRGQGLADVGRTGIIGHGLPEFIHRVGRPPGLGQVLGITEMGERRHFPLFLRHGKREL